MPLYMWNKTVVSWAPNPIKQDWKSSDRNWPDRWLLWFPFFLLTAVPFAVCCNTVCNQGLRRRHSKANCDNRCIPFITQSILFIWTRLWSVDQITFHSQLSPFELPLTACQYKTAHFWSGKPLGQSGLQGPDGRLYLHIVPNGLGSTDTPRTRTCLQLQLLEFVTILKYYIYYKSQFWLAVLKIQHVVQCFLRRPSAKSCLYIARWMESVADK